MRKLSRLLFKMAIITIASCLFLVIVPIIYIICMLFVIWSGITDGDFVGLFKYLNNVMKIELIDTYTNSIKEFWKL